MFSSGEIRWFVEGPLPGDVDAWFRSSGLGLSEPARTDDYLLLPGCATTGIKIRSGHLEVKARTQAPVPASYSAGVAGLKDAWVKWSRNSGDEASLRRLIVEAGDPWVSVRKQRHLRLFSLDGDGDGVEEAAPGSALFLNGCQAELCSVLLDGKSEWWSLSFEAFGEPGDVMTNLDRVAGDFFASAPPREFTQQDSMSYPVWLALSRS